jgi:hypothetical protein
LALIERQERVIHRQLGVNVALFYGHWGAAYLLGFGSVFLTYPSAVPLLLPGGVAAVITGVLFAAAVVVSVVNGTRAGRGVRGPSRVVGAMYGWAWTLGFCGLAAVNIGVTKVGVRADAVTLLWSGSSLLLGGCFTMPVGRCGRTGSSTAWGFGCW